eukprot:13099706-Heterocapsa_arctica.AAC.1
MFIVLDPIFGDWYYWILDWRLGSALSQIEDEVHFDLLFIVFGARRAAPGPLCLTIYSAWCQESAPRSTVTHYLQCMVPGERPE